MEMMSSSQFLCTGSSDVEKMSILACARSWCVCTGSSDRRSCQFVCVQGHRVCVQGHQIDHVSLCKVIMCVCVQGHQTGENDHVGLCVYKVISVCVCIGSSDR